MRNHWIYTEEIEVHGGKRGIKSRRVAGPGLNNSASDRGPLHVCAVLLVRERQYLAQQVLV